MDFETILRPNTLSQEIVEKIERSIVEKKLTPGQKLPTEQELCEMFSVSRTAVREALRMLSAKGLITIKKRAGMFVSEFSTANAISLVGLYLELNFEREYMLHVFAVRNILEPEVSKLAAAMRTDSDLRKIEVNLDNMRAAVGNRELESELDQQFHLLVTEAARNPIISLVLEPIFQLMPKVRAIVYANTPHCKSSALEHHTRIFEAIKIQNGDEACAAMRNHLQLAQDQARDVFANLSNAPKRTNKNKKRK
jgi:GntR family transcriptional repressor for pyruvate dehydrogenase complex